MVPVMKLFSVIKRLSVMIIITAKNTLTGVPTFIPPELILRCNVKYFLQSRGTQE